MLTIVKKKQFSKTAFIQDRSISFNKQAFFDFKNKFTISICQDGKPIQKTR